MRVHTNSWRAIKARTGIYGYNGPVKVLVADGVCSQCGVKIKDNQCACSIRPVTLPSERPSNPVPRDK